MAQLEQMLPVDTNIKEAYANGQDSEQQFIQVSSVSYPGSSDPYKDYLLS